MSAETIADITRERDRLRKELQETLAQEQEALEERDRARKALENWRGEVGKLHARVRTLEAQAKQDTEAHRREVLAVKKGETDVRKALVDLTYLVEHTGILTLASVLRQAKRTLSDTATAPTERDCASCLHGPNSPWGSQCRTCYRYAHWVPQTQTEPSPL